MFLFVYMRRCDNTGLMMRWERLSYRILLVCRLNIWHSDTMKVCYRALEGTLNTLGFTSKRRDACDRPVTAPRSAAIYRRSKQLQRFFLTFAKQEGQHCELCFLQQLGQSRAFSPLSLESAESTCYAACQHSSADP